jgi:hypothetical protein
MSNTLMLTLAAALVVSLGCQSQEKQEPTKPSSLLPSGVRIVVVTRQEVEDAMFPKTPFGKLMDKIKARINKK